MINLKRKKFILSTLISICCTVLFAVLFADVFRVNDLVYAFDDYSFFQDKDSDKVYSEAERENILNLIKNKDYIVKDGHVFLAKEDDPQIIYDMQGKRINSIKLYFGEQLSEPLHIKAYFVIEKGDGFTEEQSVEVTVVDTNMAELSIPTQNISMLRLDVGDYKGTKFILDKIEVSYDRVDYDRFNHMLILEIVFVVVYYCCIKLIESDKNEEGKGIGLFYSIKKDRKMVFYLAKTDFKNKFAGSVFGIIWGFVQPIITLLLYWFVFQVGLRSGGIRDVPFVLWLMAGLIPWFYFQEAFISATNCFIEYSYLVKKVLFNIDVLPVVKIISSLFVQVFFVLFMIVMYIFYEIYPGFEIIQLAYYTLCIIALLLSLAYLTSSIAVFFKDMSQIINIVMQIGTWMTPILWDINAISPQFRWIFKLNPMFYIVEGYRDTLIQGGVFWDNIGSTIYFWLFVLIMYLIGRKIYIRLKPHFSDVL